MGRGTVTFSFVFLCQLLGMCERMSVKIFPNACSELRNVLQFIYCCIAVRFSMYYSMGTVILRCG